MMRAGYTVHYSDAVRYKEVIERVLDGYVPPADSPMARWLWRLGEIRAGRQSPDHALKAADAYARRGRLDLALPFHVALADFLLAARLAHAVEILERNASRIDIDGSARTELGEPDHKEGLKSEAMPSGVDSFVLAGIIAESGDGRVRIAGTGSKGTDLHWQTPDGLVRIERKDRAFRRAFEDSDAGLWRWVASKVVEASSRFPADDPETPRVVVVGATLPLSKAQTFFDDLARFLRERLGRYVRQICNLAPDERVSSRVAEAICAHVAAISYSPEEMTSFQEISDAPRAAHVSKLRRHLLKVFHPTASE